MFKSVFTTLRHRLLGAMVTEMKVDGWELQEDNRSPVFHVN